MSRCLEIWRGLHACRVSYPLSGDFHLGQVPHTGRDFVIIDFEGEPARRVESTARTEELLRLDLVEKALYEKYELNNRPDWVRIPLRSRRQLLT